MSKESPQRSSNERKRPRLDSFQTSFSDLVSSSPSSSQLIYTEKDPQSEELSGFKPDKTVYSSTNTNTRANHATTITETPGIVAGQGDSNKNIANTTSKDNDTTHKSNTKDLAQQKHIRNPRATKACATCRKQKTRCISANANRPCFRCLTLGIECSLITDTHINIENSFVKGFFAQETADSLLDLKDQIIGKRLAKIESDMSQVLGLLQESSPTSVSGYRFRGTESGPAVPESMAYKNNNLYSTVQDKLPESESLCSQSESNNTRPSKSYISGNQSLNNQSPAPGAPFGFCSHSFITSPFNAFGTLVSPKNVPPPIHRLMDPEIVYFRDNIITMGLLTREQTIEILEIFLKYYNQWVSFPRTISTDKLLDLMISRSSLLLTVCCSIVIRYHEPELKSRIWRSLLEKLQQDLRDTLLMVPRTIEFIQALAILSIYASSLSENDLVFDAWFISSIALEHFITKDVLGLVMSFDGVSQVTEMDEITAYRVWNHLCLVHVVNCNLSGRMLVLDGIRLNQSRRTLDLTASTNFDGRMVAEINLQVLTYNFIEARRPLIEIKEELKLWHNDWSYLFVQPETQFVETGYHFCYFLALYHWNHRNMVSSVTTTCLSNNPSDVERVFKYADIAMLQEMTQHAIRVIEGILVVNYPVFMALSDQIHFFGSYSAVMLIRLIHIAKDAYPEFSLNSELVIKALTLCNQLASKFQLLGNGVPNIATKYASSIRSTLKGFDQI